MCVEIDTDIFNASTDFHQSSVAVNASLKLQACCVVFFSTGGFFLSRQ